MSAIPNLPETLDKHATEASLSGITRTERADSLAVDVSSQPFTNTGALDQVSELFKLHDTPIENHRPIKVIVIGAGYSGIYLGIRIPERIRNVELTIYEKNDGLGGT
jgi:hypothetical protein